MESCGRLNILKRLLRMVLQSYGLTVRIFARMSYMIWENWCPSPTDYELIIFKTKNVKGKQHSPLD